MEIYIMGFIAIFVGLLVVTKKNELEIVVGSLITSFLLSLIWPISLIVFLIDYIDCNFELIKVRKFLNKKVF